jgi:hypothetical protein
MILNHEKTALLKTALDAENSFFGWLKFDTALISNELYADIKADFEAWQEAYAENDLYITIGSNTQQLSGIDSVPIPPAR